MLTRIIRSHHSLPARNILFWVGGMAALAAAGVFRRNLAAEYFLLRMLGIFSSGPEGLPVTSLDWFTLLRENRWLALVLLNFFDTFNYLLFGVMLIALFAALRRNGEAVMFVAAALGFVGIAVFLSSNQAFALAAMADQFVFAPSEAQRQVLLAGAQGVLAVNFRESFSGAGLYPSFFCISLSGLLMAIVMRKSRIFGRVAALLGLLANAFGLGYYLFLIFAPGLIPLVLSLSAVLLITWYGLIALRFFRAGRVPVSLKKGVVSGKRRA